MASLYLRKKFWWIKYRDPSTNKIVRISTQLTERVHARKLCVEYTLKEAVGRAATPSEHWDQWVEAFWEERYGTNKLRAQCAWRSLRMFLLEFNLTAPRQILREHAHQFIIWRGTPDKSKCKYKAGRNTTILEIKFMSILLDEAVRRGYASFNPWLKLKLHRERPKEKPEYSRHALAKILWNIRHEPEPRRRFLLYSFLIARYHGCRLSETHFNPMTQVGFDGTPSISFRAKGDRVHTVYLHPKLIRRFKRMVAEHQTETYPRPKSPAKDWFNFLARIGIKEEFPNACFHSLRVTAATTLARKGVEEKKAMRYLGHASTTIHRSYVRLKPDDLSTCTDALN